MSARRLPGPFGSAGAAVVAASAVAIAVVIVTVTLPGAAGAEPQGEDRPL